MNINTLKKSFMNALIYSICLVFVNFIIYSVSSKEDSSKLLFLLLFTLSFIGFSILNILMSIIQKNIIKDKKHSASKSIIAWTVVIIVAAAIGLFLYKYK